MKSLELIQPRGELTEAEEHAIFKINKIKALLATNSVSSRIGKTEHFLLFHTHLPRYGYQPTARKMCKAQRGAELPALGIPWRVLSWHGLPHPLKPKCAAKTGEGTNTFQDIISTMQEGCAASTCQEKRHGHHNPQIHSHHATH